MKALGEGARQRFERGAHAFVPRRFEMKLRASLRLGLAAEASSRSNEARRRSEPTLEPLARAFAQRFHDYLADPDLSDPRRHPLQHRLRADPVARMGRRVRSRARRPSFATARVDWFGADRDCQAWEPGGDEFLSPALIEALCMARTHPALFPIWFEQFLPRIADQRARDACSSRRPSATEATARSRTSTGSTSAAPGAGANSAIRSMRRFTLPRPFRTSPASIWASIGSRASHCWLFWPEAD